MRNRSQHRRDLSPSPSPSPKVLNEAPRNLFTPGSGEDKPSMLQYVFANRRILDIK